LPKNGKNKQKTPIESGQGFLGVGNAEGYLTIIAGGQIPLGVVADLALHQVGVTTL
jgi:hypothetical protein